MMMLCVCSRSGLGYLVVNAASIGPGFARRHEQGLAWRRLLRSGRKREAGDRYREGKAQAAGAVTAVAAGSCRRRRQGPVLKLNGLIFNPNPSKMSLFMKNTAKSFYRQISHAVAFIDVRRYVMQVHIPQR